MAAMNGQRPDDRNANALRELVLAKGVLHRAHGSARWSQGNTRVLAAVYGPKPASKKENPERATLDVIWKPKSGQPGKVEREYEQLLKRTLDYIFLSAMHPSTSTSVILQVVNDDGSLLACAFNAACTALLDAGIPLKNRIAAICCGVRDNGEIILDLTKMEEKTAQAHVYLVFPSQPFTVVSENPPTIDGEPVEHGIITSLTRGSMSVDRYLDCLERGRAACSRISDIVRMRLSKQGQGALPQQTSS